jgi:hypothetical protein
MGADCWGSKQTDTVRIGPASRFTAPLYRANLRYLCWGTVSSHRQSGHKPMQVTLIPVGEIKYDPRA